MTTDLRDMTVLIRIRQLPSRFANSPCSRPLQSDSEPCKGDVHVHATPSRVVGRTDCLAQARTAQHRPLIDVQEFRRPRPQQGWIASRVERVMQRS